MGLVLKPPLSLNSYNIIQLTDKLKLGLANQIKTYYNLPGQVF